jgi:hypothetical protein
MNGFWGKLRACLGITEQSVHDPNAKKLEVLHLDLIEQHLGKGWWWIEHSSHTIAVLLDGIQDRGRTLHQAIDELLTTTLLCSGWPSDSLNGQAPALMKRLETTVAKALKETILEAGHGKG